MRSHHVLHQRLKRSSTSSRLLWLKLSGCLYCEFVRNHLKARGLYFCKISLMVKKFPNDLDIFSLSTAQASKAVISKGLCMFLSSKLMLLQWLRRTCTIDKSQMHPKPDKILRLLRSMAAARGLGLGNLIIMVWMNEVPARKYKFAQCVCSSSEENTGVGAGYGRCSDGRLTHTCHRHVCR